MWSLKGVSARGSVFLAAVPVVFLCNAFIAKFTGGGLALSLVVVTGRPVLAVRAEMPGVLPISPSILHAHLP